MAESASDHYRALLKMIFLKTNGGNPYIADTMAQPSWLQGEWPALVAVASLPRPPDAMIDDGCCVSRAILLGATKSFG